MADGLSRTIFRDEDCFHTEPYIWTALKLLDEGARWIWIDSTGSYEDFLKNLDEYEKEDVLELGQLHEVSVFASGVGRTVQLTWTNAYQESEWFGRIYRILLGEE